MLIGFLPFVVTILSESIKYVVIIWESSVCTANAYGKIRHHSAWSIHLIYIVNIGHGVRIFRDTIYRTHHKLIDNSKLMENDMYGL